MTYQRATLDLGDFIEEEFLKHGAGSPDILIDDIVVLWRSRMGGTLHQARLFVEGRLSATLAYLQEDRAWNSVPMCDYYFNVFIPQGLDANDDVVRRRCIAGLGHRQRRIGLHFVIGQDDLFWMEAVICGIRNGQGKVEANIRRIETSVEEKQLTPGGLDRITDVVKQSAPVKRLKRAAGLLQP